MISRRSRPAPTPRAPGTKAPLHIPFAWDANKTRFQPVGGTQAYSSEGEKKAAIKEDFIQKVTLYKKQEADVFLNDTVADEMAKEVAKEVIEEHKSQPDRDYNECFQQWLLGKNKTLNNPLITQRGYTSYVERFPRVVNWVDAQIRIAGEIRVYLHRLYVEGPATEEEVEHEFRYLVWPLNNALRLLQQARDDPALGVDVLRGVPGGAWDVANQTADGQAWPDELTWLGRVPDSQRNDVPLCLHPALNPYMRDKWVYSVSYQEWLRGDYSKLKGPARELWEVVANRTYGRPDRMQQPVPGDDPQGESNWDGRPDGQWNAVPVKNKACNQAPMPATEKPFIAQRRPWAPEQRPTTAQEDSSDDDEDPDGQDGGDPRMYPAVSREPIGVGMRVRAGDPAGSPVANPHESDVPNIVDQPTQAVDIAVKVMDQLSPLVKQLGELTAALLARGANAVPNVGDLGGLPPLPGAPGVGEFPSAPSEGSHPDMEIVDLVKKQLDEKERQKLAREEAEAQAASLLSVGAQAIGEAGGALVRSLARNGGRAIEAMASGAATVSASAVRGMFNGLTASNPLPELPPGGIWADDDIDPEATSETPARNAPQADTEAAADAQRFLKNFSSPSRLRPRPNSSTT